MRDADRREDCAYCDGEGCPVCRRPSPRKRVAKHGGKRKGAGRPETTGAASTPLIQYRVSTAQHAELTREGRAQRPRLTANAVAKRRAFPESGGSQ